MSDISGCGLQIVNVTESHKYELDEDALEQLLLSEEVKDLPVVVVSVAGAYRGGKSFLLNFFLRYLTAPMSDISECGLQIVNVTESHKYELDEDALEQLLLSEEVKDLPVVVVSVAGAYRGGKSFLLNFFLRYLTAPPAARVDGSWLGEDSEPLVGFTWRSGSRATTTGILMWSEPFVTMLPSGQKVAILLVDTQGNFDSKSTVRDNSTIFALSTLVSSVQIYNLSHDIKEDDLQHLALFTEYGKLVNAGDSNMKAFQVLEFLVRDWQFPEDYPYGTTGGNRLLQGKLEISPDLAKEMQELRQHIRSSFEKVSCFLMPHPGFNVLKATFSGNIDEISPDFRIYLIKLVESIFSPEKLLPKTINGEQIKAQDLFNYFKTYLELFNSDQIPSPTNIMEATVKAGLLSALNEARDIYNKGMESECGPKELNVPAVDLEFLHKKYVALAIAAYTHKKKMGSAEEAVMYLDKLTEDLNNHLPQFLLINQSKTQVAIDNAQDAYNETIEKITKDELICVHPLDLEKIHQTAVEAAIKTYDALRKRVTKKHDEERAVFIKGFEEQYALLQLNNEKHNDMIINQVWMVYWRQMQAQAIIEPPLNEDKFEEEHETAREKALKYFDSKRNIPNNYTEDAHKSNLIKEIQDSFVFLKSLNKSKNKEAMRSAIDEYDNYMEEHGCNSTQCMHPNDLEEVHRVAICRALTTFRPKKSCSAGFNYSDEDEVTLQQVLNQRHESLIKSNEKANESIVSMAFNEYVRSMEKLSGFSPMWLLLVPYVIRNMNMSKYDEASRAEALNVFYANRRESRSYASDPYKQRLDQMIKTYYDKNYKSQDWSSLKPFVDALPISSGGDKTGQEGQDSALIQNILNSFQKATGENHSDESSWLQSILTSLKKEAA